jgi:hypothetical protein
LIRPSPRVAIGVAADFTAYQVINLAPAGLGD